MARLHGSFVAALLLAGAACSSQPTGSAPREDEPPPSVDPGAADGDSGRANDPAAPATGTGVGFISIHSVADGDLSAVAAFMRPIPYSPTPGADGCTVLDRSDPRYELPFVHESAGPIVVAAGSRSTELEFATDADGRGLGYSSGVLSDVASPLALDEPIRIGAGGATLPAFELAVLPADEPEFTTSPAGFIVVGQPFEVRWAPKAADYVWVRLDAGGPNGGSVSCRVEATRGKIVLSSDRIAAVATDPTLPVELIVGAERRREARVGDFAVALMHTVTAPPVLLPVL
ncbi:MAG: hypothetical protein KF894_02110 [Labilithrix sp.]|nr:hypothetical protein [Labilithrix sp.]